MNFFDSTGKDGPDFLKALSKLVHSREFFSLAEEGGFNAPNDGIAVDEFKSVLTTHKFPDTNFYEFEWAIYESGYSAIRRHSMWMQLFISSLYVYCNKRKIWGIEISSDYHYLVLLLALENPGEKRIGALYLSFLEWLQVHVEADYGFDDYYCLLSWLLLRRITNTSDHPKFSNVLAELEKREYSTEDIEMFTVSDRGIEAWLELHQQIPCADDSKERFENIIFGV